MKLSDKWFTSIADDEKGAMVIINGRLELEEFRATGKLKYRIEIQLPYKADGSGMPLKEEEEMIAQVDHLLRPVMEKDKLAILTGNHLGGGIKYWIFYSRSDKVFFERLNDALEPLPLLPLEFESLLDPDWDEYLDMLQLAPQADEEEGDDDLD